MLNINSSNGYFSCLKCLQEGISIPYGHGQHIRYPYSQFKAENLRTFENYQLELSTYSISTFEKNNKLFFYILIFHNLSLRAFLLNLIK